MYTNNFVLWPSFWQNPQSYVLDQYSWSFFAHEAANSLIITDYISFGPLTRAKKSVVPIICFSPYVLKCRSIFSPLSNQPFCHAALVNIHSICHHLYIWIHLLNTRHWENSVISTNFCNIIGGQVGVVMNS